MAYFTSDFNQFFIDLAPNNNKDWFDENRKRYFKSIKEPFISFVQAAIDTLAEHNVEIKSVEPKECIFRINRDIRFSKDKAPYKMQVSAVIGAGGKKNHAADSVYIEFGPEHVRFYSGIYEPSKEELLKIREVIAHNTKEFKTLYSSAEFVNQFGEIRGEKNKILPKELKDAALIEPLIYNKQFYFFTQHPANLVTSNKLMDELVKAYLAAKPLKQFFTKALK